MTYKFCKAKVWFIHSTKTPDAFIFLVVVVVHAVVVYAAVINEYFTKNNPSIENDRYQLPCFEFFLVTALDLKIQKFTRNEHVLPATFFKDTIIPSGINSQIASGRHSQHHHQPLFKKVISKCCDVVWGATKEKERLPLPKYRTVKKNDKQQQQQQPSIAEPIAFLK